MEELKTLNLKIPAQAHKILKSHAVDNEVSLITTAQDLLVQAIYEKLKKDEPAKAS